MLTWKEKNSKLIAYDENGKAEYEVGMDEYGWYWIHKDTCDGFDGYDTAEEAQTDAEADWVYHKDEEDEDEDEGYTTEELNEILGDRLYEERKEQGLF